jgi:hypothetical protein
VTGCSHTYVERRETADAVDDTYQRWSVAPTIEEASGELER